MGTLVGTVAFAVSGALVAVRKGYDIVGVIALAVLSACGGGVIRDLLVGHTPPRAFTDPIYPAVALGAAILVCLGTLPQSRSHWALEIADAIGLGTFCVSGTLIAVHDGVGAVAGCALGVVTAVGGGVLRDVLAQRPPVILQRDEEIYAIPAFLGAGITSLFLHTGHVPPAMGIVAATVAIVARLLALIFHWHAPLARTRIFGSGSEPRTPGTPNGIRTRATAVKGRRPRPLDDGG